jgi:hypothetical protein
MEGGPCGHEDGEHALDLRLACIVLEVATENWSYSRHT